MSFSFSSSPRIRDSRFVRFLASASNTGLVGFTFRARFRRFQEAIRYLCKYLSKARPGCLKRARLWSAFGKIERTRVKDVLSDTPLIRILRRVMGKPTFEDELDGIGPALGNSVGFRPEPNFRRAIEKANAVYLFGFDPDYFERQERWATFRLAGLVDLSHPWSAGHPLEREG